MTENQQQPEHQPTFLTQNVSQEKMHYESMISLFKWVLSCVTILVSVGVWFLGSSMNDTKKQIQEELADSKKSIEDVKAEARNASIDVKANAEQRLDELDSDINYKVSWIKEDARGLAISAAKNRIEQAFENPSIEFLIENAAKKKTLEQMIKLEQIYPHLILAVDRIRAGERRSWDFLDSLRQDETGPIASMISSIMKMKAEDYENSIAFETKLLEHNLSADSLRKIKSKFWTDSEPIEDLIGRIEKSQNLSEIASDFVYLRKRSGFNFKMFDFESIKNWKRQNKTK